MQHVNASKNIVLQKDEAAGIAVDQVRVNSVTDFSVFISKDGQYDLFAAPGYKWHDHSLNQLIKDGHGALFYHTADSAKVDLYLKICQLPVIDTSLPPAQRVLQITDVGAELTKMLYDSPMTGASIAKGEEIAGHMVACLAEDNTCVAALGKLANHHWYTYYHSARVASYAIAIAIEMGLTSQAQLEELAVGCLFHDIGKSKIKLEILNKNSPLTNDEWGMIRRHPEFGDEVVHESHLTKVARDIILHHHERLDGAGYPHKLGAAEIIKEVRIASFADTFDALTTNRPYQPSRSRFEALDLIRHRFLEQLDKECYKMMVMILQRAAQKP
jgi:putative nucleotidyltransferase with HDIG domain